nr:uncharacterized protein LOC101239995 [Hydra vulgaris]
MNMFGFYFIFSISLASSSGTTTVALSGTAATDLNWSSYRLYRSQHPGPLSERSFNKWCLNNVNVNFFVFNKSQHEIMSLNNTIKYCFIKTATAVCQKQTPCDVFMRYRRTQIIIMFCY